MGEERRGETDAEGEPTGPNTLKAESTQTCLEPSWILVQTHCEQNKSNTHR